MDMWVFCPPCNFVRGDSVRGDYFLGGFFPEGIMSGGIMDYVRTPHLGGPCWEAPTEVGFNRSQNVQARGSATPRQRITV